MRRPVQYGAHFVEGLRANIEHLRKRGDLEWFDLGSFMRGNEARSPAFNQRPSDVLVASLPLAHRPQAAVRLAEVRILQR